MGTFFETVALRAVIVLTAIGSLAVHSFADEIVIDGRVKSKVSIGDFDCSKCPAQLANVLNISSDESSENLTAGELWSFFDSQGVDSLEHMTICLDIEPFENSGFGLNAVAFTIQDPENLGGFITDVSLGEDSIVVPGYEISFHKPEARLEIALGYDFMERFSADSTERIEFDFSSDTKVAFNPVFAIEGGAGLFDRGDLMVLVAFIGFWIAVFVVLNRVTRHATGPSQNATGSQNASGSQDISPSQEASSSQSKSGTRHAIPA